MGYAPQKKKAYTPNKGGAKKAYKPGMAAAVQCYIDKMFDLPFQIKQDKGIVDIEKLIEFLSKQEDGVSLAQILKVAIPLKDDTALAFMEELAAINPKGFEYNFGRFKTSVVGNDKFDGMKEGEYRVACEALIEAVEENMEEADPNPEPKRGFAKK
jgi:hypothetical protein